MRYIFFTTLFLAFTPIHADQNPERCAKISNDIERLNCYDKSPEAQINSIDAIQLLKTFALNENIDHTLYDWATGSEESSPIEWLHDGIKSTPQEQQGYFGYPFFRDGQVIITNNDEVTHKVLGRKIKSGHWNIRLVGPRGGYARIFFEPNAVTHESPSFKIDNKYIIKSIICEDEPTFSDSYSLIQFSGKKPFWLRSSHSAGSAGSSTSYRVSYNEEPTCGH